MYNELSKLMGPVPRGLCRLGMNNKIAIKTSDGYKSYDIKNKKLVNCTNFVIPAEIDDMFMLWPTRKLVAGDIVLIKGEPVMVLGENEFGTQVVNYDTSHIDVVVPEHHILMGKQFYAKVVSVCDKLLGEEKNKENSLAKMAMLAQLFGGKNGSANNNKNGSSFLPLLMMSGNNSKDFAKMMLMSSMFGGQSCDNNLMPLLLMMNGDGENPLDSIFDEFDGKEAKGTGSTDLTTFPDVPNTESTTESKN